MTAGLAYWLPLAFVVAGNWIYHMCAKSVPGDLNPFASVAVSYIIGTVICVVLFFVTSKGAAIGGELHKINWAPIAMGIAIIMMEAGNVFMYRAGWNINVAAIVAQGIVAVGLVFIGYMAFHEAITMTKVIGLGVCLVGLYIINK